MRNKEPNSSKNDSPPDARTSGTDNLKIVYTVIERGERKIWMRVGTAFSNRDGSTNVYLDATPTNGSLQIRDYVAREDADRSRRSDQRGASLRQAS